MFTHIVSRNWSRNGDSIVGNQSVEAGGETNRDETIPAETSDVLVAFVLDVSQAKVLYIKSDKDLIIETNSAGSAVNTFTLAAGVPYVWVVGDAAMRDTAGAAVTTDITALYVTNAGEDAAELQIRCLFDPTV